MYFNKGIFSMYYEKHGTGKNTILILPGWGNTRKTFNHLIYPLSLHNTVYIVDYPGFGNSIFPDKDLTIYDYTNLIRDFMEEEQMKNPTIISHSFGGRISILLCGYYKEKINKLVLIDSAGIKPQKRILKKTKEIIYKMLKKLNYLLPKRKRSLYLKRLLHLFGSTDYKSLNQEMYQTFQNIIKEDLKYYLKEIKIPTLILWGEKDHDTPLKDGYYMKKQIKDSKLVVFKKTGHFSYLSHPTSTIKYILNFIKEEKNI